MDLAIGTGWRTIRIGIPCAASRDSKRCCESFDAPMPAMQESHLHSRSPTFCSWTWSVIQKLLVNEQREVMQQINSSARRQHLAMGQLNSIQAAPRKRTGQQ